MLHLKSWMKSLIKILKNLLLIDQKLSSRNELLLNKICKFLFIERLLTASCVPSVTAYFYTIARNHESKLNIIFSKGKKLKWPEGYPLHTMGAYLTAFLYWWNLKDKIRVRMKWLSLLTSSHCYSIIPYIIQYPQGAEGKGRFGKAALHEILQ